MTQDSHDDKNEIRPAAVTLAARTMFNIDQYRWQFDALSDLIDLAPHASQLDSVERIISDLGKQTSTLSKDQIKLFVEITQKHLNDKSDLSVKTYMRELLDHVGADANGALFLFKWHETLNRTPRLPILFNSLIVTAVSTFEVQIAKLATDYYHAHPEALDAGPKEQAPSFSLSDLKKLGSIEEATELAISRRVEVLLFGSLSDWRKFFKDRLNLDLPDFAIDWNAARELFQRRHVIVHNGGYASRRYITQTADCNVGKPVEVGTYLDSDREYVQAALDQLLTIGVLLAVSAGIKLHTAQAQAFISKLQAISYETLLRRQWRVTEKMCRFGSSISITAQDAVLFTVNGWIARARLNGPESIREEVSKWDTSALAHRYRLAKSCLLGDHDTAFQDLAKLVESGDLDVSDALEWPLLEGLRSDPRFSKIISGSEQDEITQQDKAKYAIAPRSKIVHILPCPRASSQAVEVTVTEAAKQGAAPCKICKPDLSPQES
ncbi:hypothetical protein ACIG5D_08345 [Microbispora rosea]|uniref:hypothetical protein n=1 Tax=Microbispora rosea TaxID=58117 RepID=UPI0037CC7F20